MWLLDNPAGVPILVEGRSTDRWGLHAFQDIAFRLLNRRMLEHASTVLNAYQECLRAGGSVAFQGRPSPSTGLIIVLSALSLCQHVTVYGIGEIANSRYKDYQVNASATISSVFNNRPGARRYMLPSIATAF